MGNSWPVAYRRTAADFSADRARDTSGFQEGVPDLARGGKAPVFSLSTGQRIINPAAVVRQNIERQERKTAKAIPVRQAAKPKRAGSAFAAFKRTAAWTPSVITRDIPEVPASQVARAVRRASAASTAAADWSWFTRRPKGWVGPVPPKWALSAIRPGAGAIPGSLPWVVALEAASAAFQIGRIFTAASMYRTLPAANGWQKVGSCYASTPRVNFTTLGFVSTPSATLINSANNCAGNQAVASPYLMSGFYPSDAAGRVLVYSEVYSHIARYTFLEYWWRAPGSPNGTGQQWIKNYLGGMRPQPNWPLPNRYALRGYAAPGANAFRLPPTVPGFGSLRLHGTRLRAHPPKRFVRRARPGKGELEEKFWLGIRRGSVPGRFMAVHGEAADFVESFYSTLPNYLKNHQGTADDTVAQRAQRVAENIHLFAGTPEGRERLGKALLNLVLNQVEDYGVGRIGAGLAQVNRNLRTPIGIMQVVGLSRGGLPASLGYFF